MAKNKTPLKGEQKRDITEIAEQATSWIEKKSKLLVIGFIAITLVLVSSWAVSSINKKNAEKVAKASGIVNRKIELLQKSIAESEPKDTDAQDKKDQFASRKTEEMNKITDDLKSLIDTYPSKITTSFTTVKWAKFLMDNEQEEKALEVLSLLSPNKSAEFSAIPVLMKAGILAKNEKTDEALNIYNEVISVNSWSLFKNEALIQKASILQGKGEVEEAIKTLSSVEDTNEDSQFVSDSKKYIRLLRLSKKSPNPGS